MNIIPARYTEVLINLLNDDVAKEAIDQAMATYPLYVGKSYIDDYGTAYHVPTREELNKKILNYYKYREIGFETFGRFLDELETSLNEIMPYYSQLYQSADQNYNPIYNVDYIRTINREKDNTQDTDVDTSQTNNITNSSTSDATTSSDIESSTSSTNNGKNVHSATPQSELSIDTENINSVSYADDATWTQNKDNASSTSADNSTAHSDNTGTTNSDLTGNSSTSMTGNEEEYTTETTKGNFGVVSAQHLVLKYRETIINIEQQIINDPRIAELFMMVY